MVRGRRVAESLTGDGLRDRWSGLALGARMLRDEVARGSAEKETELRERFGLVPHGTPELAGGRHRAVGTAPGSGTSTTTHDTTDEEGSS
jgi:hypothetical protein